ncbi:MAG: hypothetical protein JXA18_17355 [Chitinispirillaceae bacterium]|nr:hypothetical protein [Chitinispirillaceae bacterium]
MRFLISLLLLIGSIPLTVFGQNCGEGTYNAEAILEGSTWTVRNGGTTVYTGSDMLEAMRKAVGSLKSGRTSKERVLVRGSGSMPASQSLDLPNYTYIDVCGTINVTGSASGDNAVIRGRNVHDVEVGHLTVTGGPYFGIFFRKGSNITLGQIDLRLSSGHGIRLDNDPSGSGNWGETNRLKNVRIDNVYVSGTNNHGVETYGVDGITIGKVTARKTAYCGLLLNATINAEVDTVDGEDCGSGSGYATFRMANRNGRINNNWPANIHVKYVRARRGGRGIFSVSESGGAVIDRVDISGTESNAILLENAYNVTIAGVSGVVEGKDIRIAARADEFENSRDITIQNLTLNNTALNESPCGDNIVFRNIKRTGNSSVNICSKIIDDPTPVKEKILTRRPAATPVEATLSGALLTVRFTLPQSLGNGPSLLRILTPQGKLVYAETIRENGKVERRVDLAKKGKGVFLITLSNRRKENAHLFVF